MISNENIFTVYESLLLTLSAPAYFCLIMPRREWGVRGWGHILKVKAFESQDEIQLEYI